MLDGIAERVVLGLHVGNVFANLLVDGPSFFVLRRPLDLVEQAGDPGQALVRFREGRFVLVERVAQDTAADRLQFGRDLADVDRVVRLPGQRSDLIANG